MEAFARDHLLYRFKDTAHFHNALTHPSAARSTRSLQTAVGAPSSFERLEFLGDRILDLVIAEELTIRYPNEKEGELSRRQASLVSRETCRAVGLDIGLDRLIRANIDGDWSASTHVLADSVEAILGAIFCDSGGGAAGYGICAPIVKRLWSRYMVEQRAPPRDAKTALQEWLQGRQLPLPKYELVGREGTEHAPVFKVACNAAGRECVGSGKSLKIAEKDAAALMLAALAAPD
jgi:ribonuclease-3